MPGFPSTVAQQATGGGRWFAFRLRRAALMGVALVVAAGCRPGPPVEVPPAPDPPPEEAASKGDTAASSTATGPVAILPAPPTYEPGAIDGAHAGADDKLRQALSAAHRSAENRQRDAFRHPVETLHFFGLRDDMTVLELWPGTGWYTELLAPVLKDKGSLRVTNFNPNGDESDILVRLAKKLEAKLGSDKDTYGKVQIVSVNPPDKLDLGKPNSVDLVLTFRNSHNWVKAGYADKVYKAAFRVLKPGGVLGVVQHRGKEGTTPDQTGYIGYLAPDYLISQITSAGFELVAQSEVNANPKDTKDYPEGVWTLPPNYRLGDTDRVKYATIGESDRMTLKFVKPKK